ncbi:hypothetical protein GE061_005474 [Apolygus lucorum]|uniref:Kinesin motor domain-containing protein n=1 Tax=Apolygus lucorum TaxID=248454 RepID=A0A8S9WWD6_APOLU|nr:hypothetical protein GE061_005474 [Apolygus lucorum]
MESVKVALRVRPLVKSEIDSGCRSCIERLPNEPQVSIGKNNLSYTFNYVFDENEGQGKVYNLAVKNLIENLFKGYNLTILAYGQTGSGKTYTMGTNYNGEGELGVIPRAVYDIFDIIESRKEDTTFGVTVSFLELYNESLYDLLTDKPREQSIVDMREMNNGICIPGLTELQVQNADNALAILKEGSSGRVVGATAMNAASSRSHAVFTINIKIMNKTNPKDVIASKFHLVDLAGSERSKKTGATGDRFKEGININKGLMVLGNVISQLCDGQHSFINYRDSKLTRLLQDSLGGNSVTLMIACVSPADYNQEESVSTLRYADRAKKIKNKPVVNQDPASAEISRLRKENEELRLKLISVGVSRFDCPPEHKQLEEDLKEARQKLNEVSDNLMNALTQNQHLHERSVMADKLEESLKEKINAIDSMFETSQHEIDNNLFKDMRAKITEIKAEQVCTDQQRFALDQKAQKDFNDKNEKGPATPSRHEHILAQAKINNEIDAITKSLVWKEELMAKLCVSAVQLGGMGGQESIVELRRQIAELQKEKEDLQQQMKDAALSSIPTNTQSKVSEQKLKRLQELETKVASLLKKVSEQERIIKMKESSEEKIRNLKNEILASKQLKVRLIQQMKSESDKFRSYKQEKDREVCLLRTQNLRKQNQMRKMEQVHSLQQNVLKRKLEAAAAANKRIKAALELQKAAKLKRMKSSVTDRIKDKLAEELELLETEYQAQKSLDNLIQDRASMMKELAVIKESLDDPTVSQEEKVKLHKDMKEIDDELAMRSAEISDLQQKLLDIRQDDSSRGNWDILSTMSDAKFAVSHVISLVSERVKEALNLSQQVAELKELLAEQEELSEERKKKLNEYAEYHEKAIERIEKECEEKVYVLLRRLQDTGDQNDFLSETEKIQLAALDKMEDMAKRISELEEELEKHRVNPKKPVNSFQEAFMNFVGVDNGTMQPPRAKKTSVRKPRPTYQLADEDSLKPFDASFEVDNDDESDPDYRGTPLYKRIQSLKTKGRCNCKGDCSRKICSCKKNDLQCNDSCSCPTDSCKNKSKMETTTNDSENVAPKRLRFDLDSSDDNIGLNPRRTFVLDIPDPELRN